MMDGSTMMDGSMMGMMCMMMVLGLLLLILAVGVSVYVVVRLLMRKSKVEDYPLMILKRTLCQR